MGPTSGFCRLVRLCDRIATCRLRHAYKRVIQTDLPYGRTNRKESDHHGYCAPTSPNATLDQDPVNIILSDASDGLNSTQTLSSDVMVYGRTACMILRSRQRIRRARTLRPRSW